MSEKYNPKDYANELAYAKAQPRIVLFEKDYELDSNGRLIYLNLTDLYITELDWIAPLTELQVLNATKNKIRDISPLANLKKLETLDLTHNKIVSVKSLFDLTSLRFLSLDSNKIENLEPLTNLKSLKTLWLRNNEIQNIQPLAHLIALNDLALSYNHIQNIQPLENLKSLIDLSLSHNRIQNIQSTTYLTKLERLVLSNNQVEDLKPLDNLKRLKFIYLEENPCSEGANLNPFNSHIQFLKLWLEKKEELTQNLTILLPKKVVFLGNHATGKSSLLHYLLNEKFVKTTSSTHVLNVVNHPLKAKDKKLLQQCFGEETKIDEILPILFYDFGGQDFYHGLYQSFSSKTAFQLIVYCADQSTITLGKDSNGHDTYMYPLSFWLQEKAYLEHGNTNPYFIVENKIDEKPDAAFYKTFPNLDDFETPEGLFHVFLKELVEQNTVQTAQNQLQLATLKQQLLQSLYEPRAIAEEELNFFQEVYKESVKDKLLIKKVSDYTIKGISKANMLTQLKLLENSGVLLLSQDEKEVIANPKAFIAHIHEQILQHDTIVNNGKLSYDSWEKLNNGTHAARIEAFMLSQKTLFKDADAQEVIFPNFLPLYSQDDERYFLNVAKEHLAFSLRFRYFIPFGLINVLIAHFGKEPNRKKFWRDAIYFIQHEDGTPKANVFIALNIPKLEISVSVEARTADFNKAKYIRYLWQSISNMYHFRPLPSWKEFTAKKDTNTSKSLEYIMDELIEKERSPETAFPATAKVSTDGHFYISLANLNTHVANEAYSVSLQNEKGRSKQFPLAQFQLFTDKKIRKMKKIFISYSNQDVYYKRRLEKFLQPLEKFQVAKSWSCEEIEPGLWDEQIQDELESSDIVIFMMSIDFATSDYILRDEVHKTFQQMATNEDKKIVCVLVKQYPWRTYASLKEVLQVSDDVFHPNADQSAIALAKLPDYQFLPYYTTDEEKDGKDIKRYLKAVNQWKFEEEAFTQIIDHLSKII